jgi:hypothetical protein
LCIHGQQIRGGDSQLREDYCEVDVSKPYVQAGIIVGLAVFSGLFIVMLPGLFDEASSGRIWATWVIFGIAVMFGSGMVVARRRSE